MIFDYELGDEDLKHLEDDAPLPAGQGIAISELTSPVYVLKAKPFNETYYALHNSDLATGTFVIAPTKYGKDICSVLGMAKSPGYIHEDDIVKIDRIATAEDLSIMEEYEEKEEQALEICKEKIAFHNLPMKLVRAHYLFEELKILFFFTADTRVDFRNLVKDLVAIFKMRIELRQIGVRDEARILGGCGVCGRTLCCHGVTDKLVPVSIKMAKDQNLSLNSLKISGPCGRLLCCLAYEYGFYKEARKTMPAEGTRIPYDGTVFKILEVNVPAGILRLVGDDGRFIVLPASRFVQQAGHWGISSADSNSD